MTSIMDSAQALAYIYTTDLSKLSEEQRYELRVAAINNNFDAPKRGKSRESMSDAANMLARAMRDAAFASSDSLLEAWRFAIELFERNCYLCGKPAYTKTGKPIGQIQADHIVAPSRGGSGSAGNMAPAHRQCNDLKADTPVEIVLKDKPELLHKVRIFQGIYGYQPADDTASRVLQGEVIKFFQESVEPVVNSMRRMTGHRTSYLLPPSLMGDKYRQWEIKESSAEEFRASNRYLHLDLTISNTYKPESSSVFMLLDDAGSFNSRFYVGYTARPFAERLAELRKSSGHGFSWAKRWIVLTPHKPDWNSAPDHPKAIADYLANELSEEFGSLNRRTRQTRIASGALMRELFKDAYRLAQGASLPEGAMLYSAAE